jgi:hypothetical protein
MKDNETNKLKSWLDFQTSLFKCFADNNGRLRTFRQILFTDLTIEHDWFYKDNDTAKWVSGRSNDLDTLINIREGQDKTIAKQTLQCYTPSAAFSSKKQSHEVIIHYNPIMQIDIDEGGLINYDIDEVQRAIFDLSFTCFVCKSASGKALFALLLIAEPDKLPQYFAHFIQYFKHYHINIDIGKGGGYSNLRCISYDKNMLYREDPKPIKIKRFYTPPQPARIIPLRTGGNTNLIKWAVEQISNAQKGNRFETVRKVSYTLGGVGYGLDEIKDAINNSSQYTGLEPKYLHHADECFKAGLLKPILT